MIKKEFIPYEEALSLKELGFDEPCFGFYFLNGNEFQLQFATLPNNHEFKDSPFKEVAAPTFSQAFRWFREKYGDLLRYDWGVVPHFLMIQIEMTKGKTYEEAELACLRKLIEITNEQQ